MTIVNLIAIVVPVIAEQTIASAAIRIGRNNGWRRIQQAVPDDCKLFYLTFWRRIFL